jgi:hypothetical protein
MLLLKVLYPRYKVLSRVRFPMLDGILPLKLFLPNDRSPKLVRMLKEDGRVPVR